MPGRLRKGLFRARMKCRDGMGVARVWASRSLLPCRRSLLPIPVCGAQLCFGPAFIAIHSHLGAPVARSYICRQCAHTYSRLPAPHCTALHPNIPTSLPVHTIRHRLHLHPHASATTLTTPAFPLFGRCPPACACACTAASAPSPSPTQADTAHARPRPRPRRGPAPAAPRLYHHHHYPPPHRPRHTTAARSPPCRCAPTCPLCVSSTARCTPLRRATPRTSSACGVVSDVFARAAPRAPPLT